MTASHALTMARQLVEEEFKFMNRDITDWATYAGELEAINAQLHEALDATRTELNQLRTERDNLRCKIAEIWAMF